MCMRLPPRTISGRRRRGGAKNHMVVMPDADLDQVVDALMDAAFGSAGERCMAISVAVAVGRETADALVLRLAPRVRSLNVGPGNAGPEVEMGPLVTRQHLDKVRSYIAAGVAEGDQLLVDGRGQSVPGHGGGYIIGGSLFDHVTTAMLIWKEEIVGPVLAIVRVPDLNAATQLIHQHEYGNGTAVLTRDGATAREFAHQIQVGMGHQRAHSGADGLPFVRRLEELHVRRPSHARTRGNSVLQPAQNHHLALADGHPDRRRHRHAGHALMPANHLSLVVENQDFRHDNAPVYHWVFEPAAKASASGSPAVSHSHMRSMI